jgi:hypothetical protein
MTPGLIKDVFGDLDEVAQKGKVEHQVRYIGVRE